MTALVAGCGDNRHGDDGPATVARVVTAITPNPVTAGAAVTATCTVYDTDGNVMTGFEPTLVVSPVDTHTVITDLSAVLTKAGHYAGQCLIPDVAGDSVGFDVVHALPASLTIAKAPNQTVYGVDSAVTITHEVADPYGNPIDDAVVVTTSTPVNGLGPIAVLGAEVFSYGSEGKYHVHASVTPPTAADASVVADLDLIVNQTGPAIACGSPGDGTMINAAAGTALMFTGTAIDVNGTMGVVVNGAPVTVAGDGSFSAPVTSAFGINFVDIDATDTFGVTTTKVCTFLAASQWAGTNAAYSDTIDLRLAQSAIDDNMRGGAINSLGDLLDTVANSSGLHTTLDNALTAANPLHPNTCDQQVCVPFTSICTCVLSDQVDYLNSSLSGPNTDALTLTTGGLTVTEKLDNPQIVLRVKGSAAGIGYNTSGPVDFAFIQVTATFNLALANGVPHMTVRPNSVSVSVGSISTNFSGVSGFIVNNIIVPLAQGTLKTAVANLVQTYISTNFNAVLDAVVGNLDISSLGTSFAVPRLDTGSVALGFAPSFTSINTTAARMLFGIGTKLSSTAANAFATLGAAVPAGTVLSDPNAGGQPAAVAAHIAILNQALHALWKANYFHANIDASALSGGEPGALIEVDARLPPVASFNNGTVSLALGAVDLVFDIPNAPSVALTVGIRAHTNVTLVGNSLSFTGIVIDETHLSSPGLALSVSAQAQLQMLLQGVVQQMIDTSLNGALPSLPIPSFTLPASLAAYGLPAGSNLGITTPSLVLAPPDFVLRGGFGIQ